MPRPLWYQRSSRRGACFAPIVPAMDGSPIGKFSSFLQSMEPQQHSSDPQGERAEGIMIPAIHSFGLGAIRKRERMGKRRKTIDKDDLSEDYCFVCKDGGEIRVCDFKNCLKSYHPHCLKKDESFLESGERWTCDWHSCYNCTRSSIFKCFCCPYSCCRTCIGESEFVKVKGTKGFCNNCLRIAKLIEENADVDSDGDIVDFADTDTFEFLFKDYWEIIKEKERLSLADLQTADDLLKRGEKFKCLSDLDENFEEKEEHEGSDDDCGDKFITSNELMNQQNQMKIMKEKFKSKKKNYIGWASKELIEFLNSLGKDTQQPISQHDVYEIVKNYIQASNLLRHDKKKKRHVYCDARLLSLFRRKKLNFFKIYSLLEKHFAENDESDDESFSFEEDEYGKSVKRQRVGKSSSKQKTEGQHFGEHQLQSPKKCFASITEANIKLIYLKRSLIVELMKDPNTFETKVIGCFVRRKSDPKDNYGYGPLQKMYQLNQITGVKKSSEEYKLGDINTDIVFCVSNYCKDVQISMLSDDNFEEEECEDLRKLVKEGLFKRPGVVELKEKIRTIHEVMVKHSVQKELLKLGKLIERANEKGWRKELFDYIERRKLLNKPEEIMRLMKELPDVTPDMEDDTAEDGKLHATVKNVTNQNEREYQASANFQSAKLGVITATKMISFEVKSADGTIRMESTENAANPDSLITREKHEGCENCASNVIEIDDEDEAAGNNGGSSEVNIIDLNVADGNPNLMENEEELLLHIWKYLDPLGNVQGPFSLRTLKFWMDEGFFDDDFRVWKVTQSQGDAIPLGAALKLSYGF